MWSKDPEERAQQEQLIGAAKRIFWLIVFPLIVLLLCLALIAVIGSEPGMSTDPTWPE